MLDAAVKLSRFSTVQRRIEKDCPKCGPMYYEVNYDDDCADKPGVVLATYECHLCGHVYGVVKFVPENP